MYRDDICITVIDFIVRTNVKCDESRLPRLCTKVCVVEWQHCTLSDAKNWFHLKEPVASLVGNYWTDFTQKFFLKLYI